MKKFLTILEEIMSSPSLDGCQDKTWKNDGRYKIRIGKELVAFFNKFKLLSHYIPGVQAQSNYYRNRITNIVFNSIGEDRESVKKEYYPSIRFNLMEFVELIRTDRGSRLIVDKRGGTNKHYWMDRKSFLDIGACNGEKPWAAKHICGFKEAAGLEVSKKSCDIARKFLGSDIPMFNADAFDSAQLISKYDMVYMYHPIMNGSLMERLWKFVFLSMKVGAWMAEMMPQNHYTLKPFWPDNLPCVICVKVSKNEVLMEALGGPYLPTKTKTYSLNLKSWKWTDISKAPGKSN